jgi:hypothetical protein
LAVSVYVVVADGVTAVEAPVTLPTLGLILRLEAPVTVQFSVVERPVAMLVEVAVKLLIVGGLTEASATLAVAVPKALVGRLPTFTVTWAVLLPEALVAVRVYVVVAEGVIVTDVPVTVPTLWSMLRLVASLTDQCSEVDWPVATFAELAVKLPIAGGDAVEVAMAFSAPPGPNIATANMSAITNIRTNIPGA